MKDSCILSFKKLHLIDGVSIIYLSFDLCIYSLFQISLNQPASQPAIAPCVLISYHIISLGGTVGQKEGLEATLVLRLQDLVERVQLAQKHLLLVLGLGPARLGVDEVLLRLDQPLLQIGRLALRLDQLLPVLPQHVPLPCQLFRGFVRLAAFLRGLLTKSAQLLFLFI